jgi:hypothetical protein
MALDNKSKINYVDNVRFALEMEKHYDKVLAAKEAGESPRVPVNNYIGECFYKISNKLSLRPNFIGYSYRDEMVADAIETMLYNAHHFNPKAITRGGAPNPFSYFTLVAWRAFIHRINREKKQEYVKFKVTENQMVLGNGLHNNSDSESGSRNGRSQSGVDLTSDYYNRLAEKYDKPKKEKKIGLEKFASEEDAVTE